MRTRPIRAFFYQKQMLFGVRLADWKWIGSLTVAMFFAAVFFKLHIKGLHLGLPLSIFTCLAGLSFFNWVRANRRPQWLEHNLTYLITKYTKGTHDRRPLESGESPRNINWILPSGNESLEEINF